MRCVQCRVMAGFLVQAGTTSHAAWACCRSLQRSRSARVWCSREASPHDGPQPATYCSLTEETASYAGPQLVMAGRRLQMARAPQSLARCSSCSAPSSRSRPMAATAAPTPPERRARPVGSMSCLPRGVCEKGLLRRWRRRGPPLAVSAPPSGAAAPLMPCFCHTASIGDCAHH
jgi:hypothetical protein